MNPNMRTTALGLVLAAATFFPGLASAELYKWVDEKGVTHYGERPPSDKAKPIAPRDATGGASKPAKRAGPNLQQQEREFQRRQKKRDREVEAARKAQEKRNSPAAERARLAECRRATRDLATMRGNPTAYTFAEEARIKEKISRNCP